jgi:hypothetical protein
MDEVIEIQFDDQDNGVSDTVQNFAFRTGKSRESSYSRDYDELYEILRHDREHGNIVWVLGPAVAFDFTHGGQ